MKQLPLLQQEDSPAKDVEQSIGLTNWALASDRPPTMSGWYKTRRVSAINMLQPQRRFWNAPLGFFSVPVQPHHSDLDCGHARTIPSLLPLEEIEWCGLLAKHPDHI